nr:hypothetical protein [Thermomonas carbonis]
MTQPEPSTPIFHDRGGTGVPQPRQGVGLKRPGDAIAGQVLDHAIHTTQPGTAFARGTDGAVSCASQAIGIALKAGRMPPIGAQVPQATPRDRYPQGTICLCQQRIKHSWDLEAPS